MSKSIETRVGPIKITDHETGNTYELDFSRESIVFMERQGFAVTESTFDFAATNIPRFFFYAFRKNHKGITQTQTNALLDKIGGMTPKMMERMILLYNQAQMSNNIIQDDEELEKNAAVTVELE